MKKLSIIALSLLLAGCSSAGDVYNSSSDIRSSCTIGDVIVFLNNSNYMGYEIEQSQALQKLLINFCKNGVMPISINNNDDMATSVATGMIMGNMMSGSVSRSATRSSSINEDEDEE